MIFWSGVCCTTSCLC